MKGDVPYPELETRDKINVLVVDGGMRGEALQWALSQSERAGHIETTPFNIRSPATEVARIGHLATQGFNLVLIGQENALEAGVVDHLRERNKPVCGPTAEQALLESSKRHMKKVASLVDIPTAPFQDFENNAYGKHAAHDYVDLLGDLGVIKDDGLAEGKASAVFSSNAEGHRILDGMFRGQYNNQGLRVIVEGYSTGREWSGHCSVSGGNYDIWPAAEDHKQVGEGDTGLMTGGMGVVTPLPWLDPEQARTKNDDTVKKIVRVIPNLKSLVFPGYKGKDCLEVNMRGGSPEMEAFVRNMNSDFLEHVIGIVNGTLDQHRMCWKDGYAISMVGAARGYPDNDAIRRGERITGLEAAREVDDVVIFLGSVARQGDALYSNGGRLLAVTARGPTPDGARKLALQAMENIRVGGKPPVFRSDLGLRAA